MKTIDYDKLSNSEINLKLKSLESEYEKIKVTVTKQLQRMEELDNLYKEGSEVLRKRGYKKIINNE